MSYCRWSSDDFQCDVYCYENVSGAWTTHVAGRKRVLSEPLPPPPDISDAEAWLRRHALVRQIIDRSELVDIGLPHDGTTFDDPSPAAMIETLLMLRAEGYRVPEYAIEALREEMKGGEVG